MSQRSFDISQISAPFCGARQEGCKRRFLSIEEATQKLFYGNGRRIEVFRFFLLILSARAYFPQFCSFLISTGIIFSSLSFMR